MDEKQLPIANKMPSPWGQNLASASVFASKPWPWP